MKRGNGDRALADFLSKTANTRRKLKKVAYRVLKDAECGQKLHLTPPRALANNCTSDSQLLPLAKPPSRQSPLRISIRRTSASPYTEQFSRTSTDRPLFHILERTYTNQPLKTLRKSLTMARVYKPNTPPPPLIRKVKNGKISLGKISPGRSSTRSVSPCPLARSTQSPVPGFRHYRK